MTNRADSRDMIAVHTMFRREFAALPDLVRGVGPADRDRARTVADHVDLIVDLLHTHHRSEDAHCWPLLVERRPDELVGMVELMEAQHHAVDSALNETQAQNAVWRRNPTESERAQLADRLEALPPVLEEHLAAEEEMILPMIDRHLTAAEWANVGNQGLSTLPRSRVPVVIGMLLADATDEQRQLLKDAMPTPVFFVMSRLGPIAYRRYRAKLGLRDPVG
ncbi:hypothetical protein GCM10009613_34700 [Pseudonocardia kongjuensis]|uniref:Hemerythrin-like domain-containing protein n=1 Tax=Pseudonocardia kongjuensis TaxID=102227 RepID=A0ABP4IIY9_9PSEU